MDPAGVEFVVDTRFLLLIIGAVVAGILLGSISGLIPGLHANNFALVLAGIVGSIEFDPLLGGIMMLTAGVTHSFINVVPALAIGVPDAEMAPMALPGHRLVLDGRGQEALRLSALGSGLAVVVAVPLAIPITIGMESLYPIIRNHIQLLLAGVVAGLLWSERTWVSRGGGLLGFILSAVFGLVVLDLDPAAPLSSGGVLAPIFAGLFGTPLLVDAMTSSGIPRQRDPALYVSRRRVAVTVLAGAIAGALVGYLPAISAAIASVAVLFVLPGGVDDRGYIVATSGVDTSNAIFALFALLTIGQPRSGVMVAFQEASAPLDIPVLVGAVLLTGAVGTIIVITIGDRYLTFVAGLDPVWLSGTVLGLLVVLSFLFAGPIGIGIFLVASMIGFVPVRLGAYRVHLMGVLMGPLLLE